MVSSIQLSHKIIEPPILNDKQIKGGIEILPHPYTGYTINEPPILYFEVYNLQVDDAGHAKYRTEVIVNQVKSTKNLRTIGGQLRTFKKEDASILLTDETEIAQQDDRRVLGLDITELTPGPVVITIKIEDLISGNTTETAQFFRVEKPVN